MAWIGSTYQLMKSTKAASTPLLFGFFRLFDGLAALDSLFLQ